MLVCMLKKRTNKNVVYQQQIYLLETVIYFMEMVFLAWKQSDSNLYFEFMLDANFGLNLFITSFESIKHTYKVFQD